LARRESVSLLPVIIHEISDNSIARNMSEAVDTDEWCDATVIDG